MALIKAVFGIPIIMLCLIVAIAAVVVALPVLWPLDRWRQRRRRDRIVDRGDAIIERSIRNATPEQLDRLLTDVLTVNSVVDLEDAGDVLGVAERPDRFEQA